MKKLIMRKTATLLAVLMSISILVPIIAFADANVNFTTPTNSEYTVTGQVYVTQNTYDTTLNSGSVPVYVYVLDKNGNHVYADGTTNKAVLTATYHQSANGSVYYNFDVPSASYATYDTLQFKYFYPDNTLGAASLSVFRSYSPLVSSPPSIPGTGSNPGTIVTPGANGVVDETTLANALRNGGNATIPIAGDTAVLPAAALVGGGAVTVVTSAGVSYTLPVSAINLTALAQSLGVSLADLDIRIEIDTLTGAAATAVDNAAGKLGGDVVAPAIDFKVVASGGGKTKEITDFPVYVSRSIPLTENVDNPNTVTGVVYDQTTGTVSFVPSTFATVNGKTVATIKRKGNSIYTVVKVAPKSFADLSSHWAKADVEKLAGKLVITGTSATTFEPKRSITRAEVAALLVRSLGLNTNVTVTDSTYKFSDVSAGKWYSNTVTAAVYAGIIKGYQDGTFKPDAPITRRDLAAMVVRAQAFAGKTVKLTDAQVSQALAGYTDVATLGGQKAEVAAAVSTGLMKGQNGKKLAGLSNTNRAEAATLIARLLKDVGFID